MPRLQDMAERKSDLFHFDPRKITIKEGWNARHETEAFLAGLEDLSASIASEGVKNPLTVYLDGDDVVLVDGHRRLRAAIMAIDSGSPIVSVPCIAEARYASEADRVLSMVTRNSGVPLTPLEMAEVFRRLIAFGWEQKDIARRTGMSASAVSHILAINQVSPEVRQMVEAGTVAASTAVKATRDHREQAGAVLNAALAKATSKAKPNGAAPKVTEAVMPKDEAKRLAKVKDLFLELADDAQLAFLKWARDTRGH